MAQDIFLDERINRKEQQIRSLLDGGAKEEETRIKVLRVELQRMYDARRRQNPVESATGAGARAAASTGQRLAQAREHQDNRYRHGGAYGAEQTRQGALPDSGREFTRPSGDGLVNEPAETRRARLRRDFLTLTQQANAGNLSEQQKARLAQVRSALEEYGDAVPPDRNAVNQEMFDSITSTVDSWRQSATSRRSADTLEYGNRQNVMQAANPYAKSNELNEYERNLLDSALFLRAQVDGRRLRPTDSLRSIEQGFYDPADVREVMEKMRTNAGRDELNKEVTRFRWLRDRASAAKASHDQAVAEGQVSEGQRMAGSVVQQLVEGDHFEHLDPRVRAALGALPGGIGTGVSAYNSDVGRDVRAGAAQTYASIIDAGAILDIPGARELAGEISRGIEDGQRLGDNPALYRQIATAFGNLAATLVPGIGAGALAARVGVVAPRVARMIALLANAGLSGTQIAGADYRGMIDSGMDPGEAKQRAIASGIVGAAIEGVADKFGIFGEGGNAAVRALRGFFTEGPEEGLQTITSALFSNKPVDWQEVGMSTLIGGIIGAPVNVAAGMAQPGARPGQAQSPPSVNSRADFDAQWDALPPVDKRVMTQFAKVDEALRALPANQIGDEDAAKLADAMRRGQAVIGAPVAEPTSSEIPNNSTAVRQDPVALAAPVPQVEVQTPAHLLTKEEYIEQQQRLHPQQPKESLPGYHVEAVKEALERGDEIPDAVLAQYPGYAALHYRGPLEERFRALPPAQGQAIEITPEQRAQQDEKVGKAPLTERLDSLLGETNRLQEALKEARENGGDPAPIHARMEEIMAKLEDLRAEAYEYAENNGVNPLTVFNSNADTVTNSPVDRTVQSDKTEPKVVGPSGDDLRAELKAMEDARTPEQKTEDAETKRANEEKGRAFRAKYAHLEGPDGRVPPHHLTPDEYLEMLGKEDASESIKNKVRNDHMDAVVRAAMADQTSVPKRVIDASPDAQAEIIKLFMATGRPAFTPNPSDNPMSVGTKPSLTPKLKDAGVTEEQVSQVLSDLDDLSFSGGRNPYIYEPVWDYSGTMSFADQMKQAVADGHITQQQADLANELLRKLPSAVAGVSLEVGPSSANYQGVYDAVAEIIQIIPYSNGEVLLHEVLHPAERLLPAEQRVHIASDFITAWDEYLETVSVPASVRENLNTYRDMIIAYDRTAAYQFAESNDLDEYIPNYLIDQSEYFVVNSQQYLSKRHAKSRTAGGKIRLWFEDLLSKVKRIFGYDDRSIPVRALQSLLDGDYSTERGPMLHQTQFAGRKKKKNGTPVDARVEGMMASVLRRLPQLDQEGVVELLDSHRAPDMKEFRKAGHSIDEVFARAKQIVTDDFTGGTIETQVEQAAAGVTPAPPGAASMANEPNRASIVDPEQLNRLSTNLAKDGRKISELELIDPDSLVYYVQTNHDQLSNILAETLDFGLDPRTPEVVDASRVGGIEGADALRMAQEILAINTHLRIFVPTDVQKAIKVATSESIQVIYNLTTQVVTAETTDEKMRLQEKRMIAEMELTTLLEALAASGSELGRGLRARQVLIDPTWQTLADVLDMGRSIANRELNDADIESVREAYDRLTEHDMDRKVEELDADIADWVETSERLEDKLSGGTGAPDPDLEATRAALDEALRRLAEAEKRAKDAEEVIRTNSFVKQSLDQQGLAAADAEKAAQQKRKKAKTPEEVEKWSKQEEQAAEETRQVAKAKKDLEDATAKASQEAQAAEPDRKRAQGDADNAQAGYDEAVKKKRAKKDGAGTPPVDGNQTTDAQEDEGPTVKMALAYYRQLQYLRKRINEVKALMAEPARGAALRDLMVEYDYLSKQVALGRRMHERFWTGRLDVDEVLKQVEAAQGRQQKAQGEQSIPEGIDTVMIEFARQVRDDIRRTNLNDMRVTRLTEQLESMLENRGTNQDEANKKGTEPIPETDEVKQLLAVIGMLKNERAHHRDVMDEIERLAEIVEREQVPARDSAFQPETPAILDESERVRNALKEQLQELRDAVAMRQQAQEIYQDIAAGMEAKHIKVRRERSWQYRKSQRLMRDAKARLDAALGSLDNPSGWKKVDHFLQTAKLTNLLARMRDLLSNVGKIGLESNPMARQFEYMADKALEKTFYRGFPFIAYALPVSRGRIRSTLLSSAADLNKPGQAEDPGEMQALPQPGNPADGSTEVQPFDMGKAREAYGQPTAQQVDALNQPPSPNNDPMTSPLDGMATYGELYSGATLKAVRHQIAQNIRSIMDGQEVVVNDKFNTRAWVRYDIKKDGTQAGKFAQWMTQAINKAGRIAGVSDSPVATLYGNLEFMRYVESMAHSIVHLHNVEKVHVFWPAVQNDAEGKPFRRKEITHEEAIMYVLGHPEYRDEAQAYAEAQVGEFVFAQDNWLISLLGSPFQEKTVADKIKGMRTFGGQPSESDLSAQRKAEMTVFMARTFVTRFPKIFANIVAYSLDYLPGGGIVHAIHEVKRAKSLADEGRMSEIPRDLRYRIVKPLRRQVQGAAAMTLIALIGTIGKDAWEEWLMRNYEYDPEVGILSYPRYGTNALAIEARDLTGMFTIANAFMAQWAIGVHRAKHPELISEGEATQLRAKEASRIFTNVPIITGAARASDYLLAKRIDFDRFFGSVVASNIVPSLLSDIARGMDEEQNIQTRSKDSDTWIGGLGNAFKNQIPYLRQTLPAGQSGAEIPDLPQDQQLILRRLNIEVRGPQWSDTEPAESMVTKDIFEQQVRPNFERLAARAYPMVTGRSGFESMSTKEKRDALAGIGATVTDYARVQPFVPISDDDALTLAMAGVNFPNRAYQPEPEDGEHNREAGLAEMQKQAERMAFAIRRSGLALTAADRSAAAAALTEAYKTASGLDSPARRAMERASRQPKPRNYPW